MTVSSVRVPSPAAAPFELIDQVLADRNLADGTHDTSPVARLLDT